MSFWILLLVLSAKITSIFGIHNGIPVEKGDFAFFASIYYYITPLTLSICGGSLVRLRWILTAAHCIGNTSMYTTFNLVNWEEIKTLRYYSSALTVKHPRYAFETLSNDIALIKLKIDIQEPGVFPIPMADTLMGEFEGKDAYVVGYGDLGDNGAKSWKLRKGKINILTDVECKKTYKRLKEGQMCAQPSAYLKQSPCKGDGGGSLTKLDRLLLVGVQSFIIEGCEKGMPSGYARVSYYRQWIDDTILKGSGPRKRENVLFVFTLVLIRSLCPSMP